MAEKRFYVWESYARAFDLLTDDEAGRFIKACCSFAFEGGTPDFSDSPKMALAWEIVRGQITTSIEIGIQNAERGKRGGKASGRSRKKEANTKRSTASSAGSSTASSAGSTDMNMNMNIGDAASLGGSASSPPMDGGDSDEY